MKIIKFQLHNEYKYIESLLCWFNQWHRPFGHKLVGITKRWNWKHFCFLYNAIIECPENEDVFEITEKVSNHGRNETFCIRYNAPNGRIYTKHFIVGKGHSFDSKPFIITSEALGYKPGDIPDGIYEAGK